MTNDDHMIVDAPKCLQRRTSSFSGSCQMSGTVRFQPAMTNQPQQGSVTATLSGLCNGEAARAVVHSQGTESCAAGQGTGAGTLYIGRRRLRFTYDEVRTGPSLILHVKGAMSGDGIAQGNVSPSADPVPILQACGAAGLTEAPIDARIASQGMSG